MPESSPEGGKLTLEKIREGYRTYIKDFPENGTARELLDHYRKLVEFDSENAQHLPPEEEAALEEMAKKEEADGEGNAG